MDVSIIIVNYNVEHFLEQCLSSVRKALTNVNGEVIVVDNNSVDGSLEMIRNKFPEVKLIANKENTGFSVANNQGIKISSGKYVLLLNPDTVIEEDTLSACFNFMEERPNAGGLGVKMIDGKGVFLPESKRGLPTPEVSFYKIFGLSKFFPKSKRFGRYHLGFLDKEETHEIEILSGAFMWMRRSTLDKVGLLDEDFFMYGEDIDLSYRIILGGYKNYYYPGTKIIHYKGESTKKGSLNYVFVFYNAMIIFAKKHLKSANAQWFILMIKMAIYLRAFMAIAKRFVKWLSSPLLDASVLISLFYGLKWSYEHMSGKVLKDELYLIAIPSFTLIYLFFIWLQGGYDKKSKPLDFFKGAVSAALFILVIYALLPESLRFSRAIVLSSGFLVPLYYLLSRSIFKRVQNVKEEDKKRILIVSSENEANRIKTMFSDFGMKFSLIDFINAKEVSGSEFIDDYVRIHKIDEIIFSSLDLSSNQIISLMAKIEAEIEYKIAQANANFIIGSNSINTNGALYGMSIDPMSLPKNKRHKRIFDLLSSFSLLLLVLPLIWKKSFLRLWLKAWKVFIGEKHWISNGGAMDKAYIPWDIVYGKNGSNTEHSILRSMDFQWAMEFKALFRGWNKLLEE